MENVKAVVFKNKQGLNLFGIVHSPNKKIDSKKAIIILSPGIKSRVAPHRLYIKMAQRFTDIGFMVLRFDFYGLGDSEGEIEEKYVANLYSSIQVGRYIDDTISALDFMQTEYGIEKFILSGLCGGAISGLIAGSKDERIDSIIGLGMPVILDSNEIDMNKYLTKGQLNSLREGYLRKIFSPKSWLRFVTFQSDFRVIFNSVIKQIIISKVKTSDKKQQKKTNQTSQVKVNDNFNKLFPDILHNFCHNRKVYLIFSQADRLFWEYEEKYKSRFEKEFGFIKENVNVDVVANANHIFSFKEWQVEMLDLIEKWIQKNYS